MGEQETNRVQRGEESGGGSLEQQWRELCSPVPWRQRWWVTGTEEGEKSAGQAEELRSHNLCGTGKKPPKPVQ